MADFLHCNKCYVQPSQDQQKFYLATCTHISCKKCLSQQQTIPPSTYVCGVCKKNGQVVEIGSKMPQEALDLFTPIEKMIEDHIVELNRVLKFQDGQVMHLNKHIDKLRARLNQLMQAGQAQNVQCTKMKQEIGQLQISVQFHQNQLSKKTQECQNLQQQIAQVSHLRGQDMSAFASFDASTFSTQPPPFASTSSFNQMGGGPGHVFTGFSDLSLEPSESGGMSHMNDVNSSAASSQTMSFTALMNGTQPKSRSTQGNVLTGLMRMDSSMPRTPTPITPIRLGGECRDISMGSPALSGSSELNTPRLLGVPKRAEASAGSTGKGNRMPTIPPSQNPYMEMWQRTNQGRLHAAGRKRNGQNTQASQMIVTSGIIPQVNSPATFNMQF